MSIFNEKGTLRKIGERLTDILVNNPKIDENLMDDIEEALVMSDINLDTTEKIMEMLRQDIKVKYIKDSEDVKKALIEIISKLIDKGERQKLIDEYPLIILVIGINGGGKTTSIAKLAKKFKDEGRSVILAAADTYRAAASKQLEEWGEKVGARVIKHKEGTDPSAVIYDAIQASKANKTDVLICDTAGRLQNKTNLMKELEKMNRVIDREYQEAKRETLLVIDATTGKNAINQAEEFNDVAELTGMIITKLDGTARGGIAITITDQYDIPIKYVGIGEGMDDLIEFIPKDFAGGIFDE